MRENNTHQEQKDERLDTKKVERRTKVRISRQELFPLDSVLIKLPAGHLARSKVKESNNTTTP